MEGVAYMAEMVGFVRIDIVPADGYTLGKNEYDDRIELGGNSEFDRLVFLGS